MKQTVVECLDEIHRIQFVFKSLPRRILAFNKLPRVATLYGHTYMLFWIDSDIQTWRTYTEMHSPLEEFCFAQVEPILQKKRSLSHERGDTFEERHRFSRR